ncbi:MAG: hypothetical protein RL722_1344 [Pseudomonadota bacterium]|jgi:GNAT superfamily N-acetyltransferase
MTPPAWQIETLGPGAMDLAIEWAAREGWNPGLGDAAAFHAADTTGFLLARLDGLAVATISAVRYGADFGFIGLYIVAPEQRGQGHGWRLWQQAMANLAGRNVGLDGVLAQQDNYRRSGFRLAHRNVRHSGTADPLLAKTLTGQRTGVISEVGTADLDELVRLDRRYFPAERPAFLRHWLGSSHGRSLVLREDGVIQAYATLRPCRQGWKVGPLNARRPAQATALLAALVGSLPAGSVYFLDIPEPNGQALALAQALGMSPVFETARMYTGEFPDLPLAEIYGITSFELG